MNQDSDVKQEIDLNDYYNYNTNFNVVESLLFFCAGADQELLKRCPRYDQVKLMGIGGIVLATSVLAFFVGSYAFSIIFTPKGGDEDFNVMWVLVPALFGVLWALVIFNMDRFIVSVSGGGDGTEKITWGELGGALPRLLIAGFIGLTLAKPVEIKLMESEINSELSKQQQTIKTEYFQKELGEHRVKEVDLGERRKEIVSQRDKVLTEIQEFQQRRDEADRDYARELDGSGGTRSRGIGPIAERKKETLDRLNEELNKFRVEAEAKVSTFEERLKSIDTESKTLSERRDEILKESEQIAKSHDGLMKRIAIAHELYPLATYMLTGLFIALELCPVLFKLMVPLSTYDYLKENQKRLALAKAGIDIGTSLVGDKSLSSGKSLDGARYFPAEKMNQATNEKAEIELELTKQAQQKFLEIVSKDIQSNPEKYVQVDSRGVSKT